MPKLLRRLNTPSHAHFLTFSCFNRRPFLVSTTLRAWLGGAIISAGARHNVALWGYVVMPEHVHLLVMPREPVYDIGKYLAAVKLPVAKKALRHRIKSGGPDAAWEPYYDVQPNGERHFRIWQRGGGYDRNIDSIDEAREKLDYMHKNPLTRGLCERPQDWQWSSASQYLGLGIGPIPVQPPDL